MYGYGLKGYALNERINVVKNRTSSKHRKRPGYKPHAYIFKYKSLRDAEFVKKIIETKSESSSWPFSRLKSGVSRMIPGTIIIDPTKQRKRPGLW